MPRSKELSEQMKARSRSSIVDAALELFAKKGFAVTTTAEIARKAKVSKGLIFTHFATKEDILLAIIEDSLHRAFPEWPADSDTRSPRELLIYCFSSWSNLMTNEPLLLQLVLRLYTDTTWSKVLLEKGEGLNNAFWGRLRKVLARVGSDEPEIDTHMIHVFFDGLLMHNIFAKGTFPLEKVRDRFIEIVLDSYRRKER